MRYYRKVIRITAEQSPNVQRGLYEVSQGIRPTNKVIVPGVLTYDEYCNRLATWDEVSQCIGLKAQFYEGAEVLLLPPQWLNAANDRAVNLPAFRRGVAMGIDTAAGGDNTCWTVSDHQGIIEQVSKKTPDTNVICGETVALGRRFSVDPINWIFDLGGGGQQAADRLRAKRYKVQTLAFGSPIKPKVKRGKRSPREVEEINEDRMTFKNIRAQLYGEFRLLLAPDSQMPFALPSRFTELRRQLSLIPLKYDNEGKMILPPKRRKSPNDSMETLEQLIGCSPDEADSAMLSVYGVLHPAKRRKAGTLWN